MIDSNIPDDTPLTPPRDPYAMMAAMYEAAGLGGIQHHILVDREVVPVSYMEWARWSEQAHGPGFEKHCRVGETFVGPCKVSTVFLISGIDYSWGIGPPLFFETMVFGGLAYDDCQWRWSTYEEAEAGHAAIVESVRQHYSRWWVRTYETVAAWLYGSWHRFLEEDEWDWSSLTWHTNEGAHEAKWARMKRELEWARQQHVAALAAADDSA